MTAFIALKIISSGISGQLSAIVSPTIEAKNISIRADISEKIRTKKPTVRDTKLSSMALNLSSSARPGVAVIIFHGANKVLRRTEIEKESSTFFTKLTAPLLAWAHPALYHHWKNSRNNISFIVP
jgi:hypothetical protein